MSGKNAKKKALAKAEQAEQDVLQAQIEAPVIEAPVSNVDLAPPNFPALGYDITKGLGEQIDADLDKGTDHKAIIAKADAYQAFMRQAGKGGKASGKQHLQSRIKRHNEGYRPPSAGRAGTKAQAPVSIDTSYVPAMAQAIMSRPLEGAQALGYEGAQAQAFVIVHACLKALAEQKALKEDPFEGALIAQAQAEIEALEASMKAAQAKLALLKGA